MLTLTPGETAALAAAVTVVGLAFAGAVVWCAWRQQNDIDRLRSDLEDVQAWAWEMHAHLFGDDDGNGPPDDDDPEPPPHPDPLADTLRADPWDSWARKNALLHRYGHVGQHRR